MPSSARNSAFFGPSLVIVGLACQEVGASIAVTLFPTVGPVGMVTLRLVFSALILLLISRPALRNRSAIAWRTAVAFGLSLSGMNVCFYLALERLPLGTTVTIEFLGPLVLSVVAGRRWLSLVWAVLAALGVVMLGGGMSDLDPIGVMFALAAAALWVGYILFAQATGVHFRGVGGLAIATAIGSIPTIPLALAATGVAPFVDPGVLLAGLGIALLSSAIPYALELTALRRVTASAFAVLLSLAPAIAAAAGFAILGQSLGLVSLAGIACVIAASIGAIRTQPRPAPPEAPADG